MMSDTVDSINKEFDEYQLVLSLKEKKLKILVDFSSYDSYDDIINLINDSYE